MAIRQPIVHKKPSGILTRFRLRVGKRFGHSPEKRRMYKQQLEKVQQELKEAKRAA